MRWVVIGKKDWARGTVTENSRNIREHSVVVRTKEY
jgi:hypothetical protein